MRVDVLRLWNVRAYAETELRPGSGVTVLHGDNAAGKSTLLEAIGLFATLSSPRTGTLSQIVRHGVDEAGARLEWDAGPEMDIRIKGGRTYLRSAGGGVSAKDFLGRFRAVLFTPEDLDLVRGEPDLRRRALDELIIQLRPVYRGVKQDFERALRQRNAALRQGRASDASLYDASLAAAASQMIRARRRCVADMAPRASALYEDVAGAAGPLSLRYKQASGVDEVADDELESYLRMRYQQDLHIELERGTTRAGPHRDDLEFEVRHTSAKAFASRGEQRSSVLAFRLAQLQMLDGAVLLLDDVLSELDADRRAKVFEIVGHVQTIVSTTDMEAIPASAKIDGVWSVRAGTLTHA